MIQKNNKRYNSIVRVSSNNVDMTELDFAEIVEITLDHYRLDQFDNSFIMNYQKISQNEIRSDTKARMVLSFLNNNQNKNQKIANYVFLGAAYKPSTLGFLYQVFLKLANNTLYVAEVYIESYSNKLSLKSYKALDFDSNLVSINLQ